MPPAPLAHDRAGPRAGPPVLLLHAGVADRRMWDPQWAALTAAHDCLRVDLRGFGDSADQPDTVLDHVADVRDTLAALGIGRCHVVGASMGAGVAVELALAAPDTVGSLLLVAPGGSLLPDWTPDLRAFVDAERAALAADDLDAAVEANLVWWVDGPTRSPDAVPVVRERVAVMQRRAFEVTAGWDVDEVEGEPLARLGEIGVPTLVLAGALDLDVVGDAADAVVAGIGGAQRVDWPDVAHLPSMERPDDFGALLLDRLRAGG